MNIKIVLDQLAIWEDWRKRYKKYVPRIIEEASKGVNYYYWDSDVFKEYFEVVANCVASLKQGYFTIEERNILKRHWMDFAGLLQQIALEQNKPQFDLYREAHRVISSLIKSNRPASIHRLIAALQPNLLTTMVNEKWMDRTIKYLHNNMPDRISISGDYYARSYKVCKLLRDLYPERNPMDNITLPSQIYEQVITASAPKHSKKEEKKEDKGFDKNQVLKRINELEQQIANQKHN